MIIRILPWLFPSIAMKYITIIYIDYNISMYCQAWWVFHWYNWFSWCSIRICRLNTENTVNTVTESNELRKPCRDTPIWQNLRSDILCYTSIVGVMYIYLKAHITAMTLTHGKLNLTNYSPYKECGIFVQFARWRQGCREWLPASSTTEPGRYIGAPQTLGYGTTEPGLKAAPSYCCIVSWEPQRGGALKLRPVSVAL